MSIRILRARALVEAQSLEYRYVDEEESATVLISDEERVHMMEQAVVEIEAVVRSSQKHVWELQLQTHWPHALKRERLTSLLMSPLLWKDALPSGRLMVEHLRLLCLLENYLCGISAINVANPVIEESERPLRWLQVLTTESETPWVQRCATVFALLQLTRYMGTDEEWDLWLEERGPFCAQGQASTITIKSILIAGAVLRYRANIPNKALCRVYFTILNRISPLGWGITGILSSPTPLELLLHPDATVLDVQTRQQWTSILLRQLDPWLKNPDDVARKVRQYPDRVEKVVMILASLNVQSDVVLELYRQSHAWTELLRMPQPGQVMSIRFHRLPLIVSSPLLLCDVTVCSPLWYDGLTMGRMLVRMVDGIVKPSSLEEATLLYRNMDRVNMIQMVEPDLARAIVTRCRIRRQRTPPLLRSCLDKVERIVARHVVPSSTGSKSDPVLDAEPNENPQPWEPGEAEEVDADLDPIEAVQWRIKAQYHAFIKRTERTLPYIDQGVVDAMQPVTPYICADLLRDVLQILRDQSERLVVATLLGDDVTTAKGLLRLLEHLWAPLLYTETQPSPQVLWLHLCILQVTNGDLPPIAMLPLDRLTRVQLDRPRVWLAGLGEMPIRGSPRHHFSTVIMLVYLTRTQGTRNDWRRWLGPFYDDIGPMRLEECKVIHHHMNHLRYLELMPPIVYAELLFMMMGHHPHPVLQRDRLWFLRGTHAEENRTPTTLEVLLHPDTLQIDDATRDRWRTALQNHLRAAGESPEAFETWLGQQKTAEILTAILAALDAKDDLSVHIYNTVASFHPPSLILSHILRMRRPAPFMVLVDPVVDSIVVARRTPRCSALWEDADFVALVLSQTLEILRDTGNLIRRTLCLRSLSRLHCIRTLDVLDENKEVLTVLPQGRELDHLQGLYFHRDALWRIAYERAIDLHTGSDGTLVPLQLFIFQGEPDSNVMTCLYRTEDILEQYLQLRHGLTKAHIDDFLKRSVDAFLAVFVHKEKQASKATLGPL